MGPPGFFPCFVCGREFGSKSLDIHTPQCLQKWRQYNASLPEKLREKTPSPQSNNGLTDDSEVDLHLSSFSSFATVGEESSNSSNSQAKSSSNRTSNSSDPMTRPSTATLNKPEVLDISLKHEIDMSSMTRRMLETLILSKESLKSSSDYSSDFSSCSTVSSPELKRAIIDTTRSLTDELNEDETERPSTMRLKKRSSNISVPVISTNSRTLPRRGKTANVKNRFTDKKRFSIADEILGSKQNLTVITPCRTCGKDTNPERLHTHPKHEQIPLDKKPSKEQIKALTKLISTKSLSIKSDKLNSLTPSTSRIVNAGQLRGHLKLRNVKGYKTFKKNHQSISAFDFPHKKLKRNQKLSLPADGSDRPKSSKKSEYGLICRFCGHDFAAKSIAIHEAQCEMVCGHDFAAKSIAIHEAQCEMESKGENNVPHKTHRRGLTQKTKNTKSKEEQNGASPDVSSSEPRKSDFRPTILCYICGREFGSRSIGIHEPQCLMKWKNENEKLPKNQRMQEPSKPQVLLKDDGKVDKQAMAEAAWKSHLGTLVKCSHCNRTFFPERIAVHEQRCKVTSST